MSKLDELERLSRLRASGALSQKEFEAAKENLLQNRSFTPAIIAAAAAVLILATGGGFWMLSRQTEVPEQSVTTELVAETVTPEVPVEQIPDVTQSPTATTSSKIDQLLDPTLLGGNLQFFEAISGPAKQIHGELRLYELGSCLVSLTVSNQRILSISTSISRECNPGSLGHRLNGMTLSQAAAAFGQGTFDADCLRGCGNAFDPGYTLAIEGYRANGFTSYLFTAQSVSEADWRRIDAWETKMVAAEGEDYVIMGRYRCDDRYQPDAASAVSSLRIASVMITNELERPQC